MRGVSLAILAVALQSLFLPAVQAQTTITYNASGDYAESFFFANGSYVDLFVARGCASTPCVTTTGTFIVWFAYNADNSVTEGDGMIPDSAFQATTLQHMSLNVDTSQVPGFNTSTCTFASGIFTCTSGPFGVMRADWQSTRESSVTDLEDTVTMTGPFTTKAHSDLTYDSGVSMGTFLGAAFSDSSRTSLGTNRAHSMSITKPH